MGTREYEGLPKTRGWRNVVGLIGSGAGFAGAAGVSPGTLEEIADATLDASVAGLERAKGDEGLSYCFYLLAQLTQAARAPDFLAALTHLGLPAPKAAAAAPASDSLGSDYDIYDLVASVIG